MDREEDTRILFTKVIYQKISYELAEHAGRDEGETESNETPRNAAKSPRREGETRVIYQPVCGIMILQSVRTSVPHA